MIKKKISLVLCWTGFIGALIALISWSSQLKAIAMAPQQLEETNAQIATTTKTVDKLAGSLEKYIAIAEEREGFKDYRIGKLERFHEQSEESA